MGVERSGSKMEGKVNSLIVFIFIILIVSCSKNSQIGKYKMTASYNKNSQMEIFMVSPELYEFDKKTIAEAYLNNIEYYRLHYPYDLELRLMQAVQVFEDSTEEKLINEQLNRHFEKYPKVKDDPANFYLPHANRTLTTMDYVNSPIPTKEQVFVSTDSIIYNKDASLCIAFLCIEEKFDDIEGLEKIPHNFSAEAMVGYRKHPKDTLRTYPLTFFRLMSYERKQNIVNDLIELYSTRLKGCGPSGSIYEDKRFNHNVGEKGFFTDSPLFMKYDDTTYYFQMYKALGKDYRYDYPY